MKTAKRIYGIDIARALAILGMVIVHFNLAMGTAEKGPGWLIFLVRFLEGKAAATFVVLAGLGLSLLSQRAFSAGDVQQLADCRKRIGKRAIFLFVLGLAWAPLWPGDILHFYGLYLLFGTFFLNKPNGVLWAGTVFVIGMFMVLLTGLDYEKGWVWETLEYTGFWTPSGMIRHLFFNGFHPIFPWFAFLLLGMWLGRLNLADPKIHKPVLWVGGVLLLGSHLVSMGLVALFHHGAGWDLELVIAFFGTQPLPPLPIYLAGGMGAACTTIGLCVAFAQRFPKSLLTKALVPTGQMALSHYLAHVILGIGFLEVTGQLSGRGLAFSVFCSFVFFGCAIVFSLCWQHFFKRGPLEAAVRWVAG